MGLIDTSMFALGVKPKTKAPKPNAWKQSRIPYSEKKVLDAVRAIVFRREGERCKAAPLGGCQGGLQLAHMEGHRKSQTRGLEPHERHNSQWCVALCAAHHGQEEAHLIRPVYADKAKQCNGLFYFTRVA